MISNDVGILCTYIKVERCHNRSIYLSGTLSIVDITPSKLFYCCFAINCYILIESIFWEATMSQGNHCGHMKTSQLYVWLPRRGHQKVWKFQCLEILQLTFWLSSTCSNHRWYFLFQFRWNILCTWWSFTWYSCPRSS